MLIGTIYVSNEKELLAAYKIIKYNFTIIRMENNLTFNSHHQHLDINVLYENAIIGQLEI